MRSQHIFIYFYKATFSLFDRLIAVLCTVKTDLNNNSIRLCTISKLYPAKVEL